MYGSQSSLLTAADHPFLSSLPNGDTDRNKQPSLRLDNAPWRVPSLATSLMVINELPRKLLISLFLLRWVRSLFLLCMTNSELSKVRSPGYAIYSYAKSYDAYESSKAGHIAAMQKGHGGGH